MFISELEDKTLTVHVLLLRYVFSVFAEVRREIYFSYVAFNVSGQVRFFAKFSASPVFGLLCARISKHFLYNVLSTVATC